MKNSPFRNPALKAQSGRNVFDLSFMNQFSSPLGALIPCGCWEVSPNDKFKISCESQFTLPEMIRPTIMRLKEHIDYFFVPYSALWTAFDNFITGQNYYYSKLVSDNETQGVPNRIPTFDMGFVKAAFVDLYGQVDINGYDASLNMLRLLDMLGYGDFQSCYQDLIDGGQDQSLARSSDIVYNFWRLLAYQKIYYDYYRNDKYESADATKYNIDNLIGGTSLGESNYTVDYRGMFNLRYRWLKYDYFNCTKPSVLPTSSSIGFNGISTIIRTDGSNQSDNNVFTVPGSTYNSIRNQFDGDSVISYITPNTGSNDRVNISSIRLGFAYDKLLRRMRNAGQNFDKQMLAQFGITNIDERHGRAYKIGGFTNRINVSTNIDLANNLADFGGSINSYNQSQGRPLEYHAKSHGLIMAIYSTSIDPQYSSDMIERANVKRGRFDYFNPVFENIGLQSIFDMEYRLFDDSNQTMITQNHKDVIGYNNRYMEYKTHIDEIHGRYNKASNLVDFQSWVVPISSKYKTQTGVPLSMLNLVVDPAQFNGKIRQNDYDGTTATDHFGNTIYHRVTKVANMSVYGETF